MFTKCNYVCFLYFLKLWQNIDFMDLISVGTFFFNNDCKSNLRFMRYCILKICIMKRFCLMGAIACIRKDVGSYRLCTGVHNSNSLFVHVCSFFRWYVFFLSLVCIHVFFPHISCLNLNLFFLLAPAIAVLLHCCAHKSSNIF